MLGSPHLAGILIFISDPPGALIPIVTVCDEYGTLTDLALVCFHTLRHQEIRITGHSR